MKILSKYKRFYEIALGLHVSSANKFRDEMNQRKRESRSRPVHERNKANLKRTKDKVRTKFTKLASCSHVARGT